MKFLQNIIFMIIFWSPMNISGEGLVVALQGTTSAGKSSIVRCLKLLLQDFDVSFVCIDDFLWKAVIEEAKLLGFVHEDMSLDEIQKIVMMNRDLIFAKFKKNNWIEPKKELHRAVKKLAMTNKLVVLDTVHSNDADYADFLEQMKDVKVICVQVYCSPLALVQHVIQRNVLVGYAERRDLLFTLQQYCRLYQLAESLDVIDRISLQDIEQFLAAAHKDLQATMPPEIAQEKLDAIRQLYNQAFSLQGSDHVPIASKYLYDLLVNTGQDSPEKCAQLIYEIIQPQF